MLPLSVTLLKVAVWGLLGLWAGAAPVKVVDDKAGVTRIVDKATGQRVIYSYQRVSYTDGKRHWQLKPQGQEKGFDDVLLSNNALYTCLHIPDYERGAIFKKYSLYGQLIWSHRGITHDNNKCAFSYLWSEYHLIGTVAYGHELMGTNKYELLDDRTGKLRLTLDSEAIGASHNFLLAEMPFLLPREMPESDVDSAVWEDKLSSMAYQRLDFKGKQETVVFQTPPREGCVPYSYPKIAGDDPQKAFEDLNIVKGEYIYAHRADGCGKFTYKFHWTDPKNPAPQILQGWK